ncbi:MAG: hypothetical protein O3B20_04565 [Bacteroidetes bacterium]|nr:hypothetical protein [Bacteroidota bacterium]
MTLPEERGQMQIKQVNMILKYDNLIFRGAIIKIDGARTIDDNGFYILTISNDFERPLLLVKVSGYKAGLERGFIRCEKIQKGTVGITMKNLIEEIQWNFPDIKTTGIEVYNGVDSDFNLILL